MDHVLFVDILLMDNPTETMTGPLEDHQTTTITKTTAHHHQVQEHRNSNNSNKEAPAAAEAVFYPASHLYLAVSAEPGQAPVEQGIAGQQATAPGNQGIISNSGEDGRIPYRPKRTLIRN